MYHQTSANFRVFHPAFDPCKLLRFLVPWDWPPEAKDSGLNKFCITLLIPMSYLSIIPARGGSVGLPRKNILPVGGKPLIAWSILQSLAVKSIKHVVVSTDSPEIAAIAKEYGAETPFVRPPELASNEAATEPVMLHALDYYESVGFTPDAVILLQPTSPLRFPGSLESAIKHFEQSGADSLLSVCENHHFFWRNPANPEALYDYKNRPRRQDIRPENRTYRENGSIYITKTSLFRSAKNRLCGKIAMFCMDEREGWEIDSPSDLIVASSLIKESLKYGD